MMSTPRLKTLHRLETNQRKFMCIMNDVAKMQQSKYEVSIEREKQEAAQTCDKSISKTRKNLVRRRVLKKCMQTKREEVEKQQANKIFGRYQGETAEYIAGQIDTYLEENHPRLRRKQKINALFKTASEKGVIMDDETMKEKVRNYFTRPLIHIQQIDVNDKESGAVSTIPSLSKPFYTGHVERQFTETPHDFHKERYDAITEIPESDDWNDESDDNDACEKVFIKRKPRHFLTDEVRDARSVQSDTPKTVTMPTQTKEMRPLTLPVLKPERDVEVPVTQAEKPKVDCISELIGRLHRAKDVRDRDAKMKKEKRTKRLQAERVRAAGLRDTRAEQSRNNWGVYEAKKNELLTNISLTKQTIGLRTEEERRNDAINQKGRLYLPPISVTQRVVLTKLGT